MVNYKARNLILVAVKSADETKNSDDTLANDTELTLQVQANTRYIFRGMYYIKSHATPDWKYKHSVPSGTTGFYNNADITKVPSASAVIATESNLGTDDTLQLTYFYGTIIVGSTAGTFALQWAQNTSDANATIVKAGSYIELIPEVD